MARIVSSTRRVHIVLIPGFAGFDALGQMEYYTGLTPHFRHWLTSAAPAQTPITLHYFDNFPTAAVATRAERLQDYLAKRLARGEFLDGDEVALVGHSTGGLDIRRLLWNLAHAASARRSITVDGGAKVAVPVEAERVLAMIKRVVFLSVPQWGTNIADWVRSYALGRQVIVAELRAAVLASQVPLVDCLQGLFTRWATGIAELNLGYAIRDALAEAEADRPTDALSMAMAQEAASELQLWLRHMATDFSAIDDLAALPPHDDHTSPAHFTPEMREIEIDNWQSRGIQTRSYATIGTRPYLFPAGRSAPCWSLLNPWTYPDLTSQTREASDADLPYLWCYRACAGGPFSLPDQDTPQPVAFAVRNELRSPELWDNDGIVNTRSMLWPDGEQTRLVEGDHMDIVGHYTLVPAREKGPRQYDAYNLLVSHSGFNLARFRKVWSDVFEFCTGAAVRASGRASSAAE